MPWGFPWCCSVEPAGATEKVGKSGSRSSLSSSARKKGCEGEGTSTTAPGPAPPEGKPPPGSAASPAAAARGAAAAGGSELPPVVILPVAAAGPKGEGKPAVQKAMAGTAKGRVGGETKTAAPAAKAAEQEADDTCSMVSASSHISGRSSRSMGTTSSVASELINERLGFARLQEAAKIQQAMKTFVRSMVRGQQMGVISPDGALRTCSCSLDKKLKTFIIELKGSRRHIPLAEMSEVFQGKEPEDIDTPLDELCSTVMLQSQECISFHFSDVPAREHFAMCLQVLVDGQQ